MITTTHTPGPWVVSDGSPPEIYASDKRQTIVAVVRGAASNPQVVADARLISAAPDMLDALRMVYAQYVWMDNSVDGKFFFPTELPSPADLMTVVSAVRAAIAKAKPDAP